MAPPPPPRTLTKEEIKAQRKADLHHLNLLKMRLQPIMDQIHRKYRKFRQPVIPFAQIAYLFDEADPNFVRPDITEAEGRPFELAKDREGTEGIRETATGKFFYNLETTTIEERLANGYYARPIDFYKDINRLYLDSKNIGDRDRTLKANELRTNVEVDVHDIGQALSNQGIRFEEIYARQLQRAKEAEEKARKRKALQPVVDLIQSDLPGDGDSDSQGPVGIGLPMTRDVRTTTAARFQPIMSPESNGHGDTTDSHRLTNGTSGTSRPDGEDVHMGGLDDDRHPMPGHPADLVSPLQWSLLGGRHPLGDSTRATAGTQLSQRSAITSVPPGVTPSAMLNDASTTKTSELSTNRDWSTQHTNGAVKQSQEPSQLVDTQLSLLNQSGYIGPSQSSSSGTDWIHSQADAIAKGRLQPRLGLGIGLTTDLHPGDASHGHSASQESTPPSSGQRPLRKPSASDLGSILEDNEGSGDKSTSSFNHNSGNSKGTSGPDIPTATPRSGSGPSTSMGPPPITTPNINNSLTTPNPLRQSGRSNMSSQQALLDERSVADFSRSVADRTAGCTVEQLEQIYRELMDEIWRTRNDWNRMNVLSKLKSVFNDTIGDIELVQGVLLGNHRKDGADGEDGEVLDSVEGLNSQSQELLGQSQSQGVGGSGRSSGDDCPWLVLR